MSSTKSVKIWLISKATCFAMITSTTLYQHQELQKSLPEDHAIVYADFSQNYALLTNDEIQAAHYSKPQVTIHTMYLVRHSRHSTAETPVLTKEAIP